PWVDLSFPGVPDSIMNDEKKHRFIRWEDTPIQYFAETPMEEINWLGVAGTQQIIRIFPNYGTRKERGMNEIKKITGVNHFFLDMDLVTHYVHPFTVNFFNKL